MLDFDRDLFRQGMSLSPAAFCAAFAKSLEIQVPSAETVLFEVPSDVPISLHIPRESYTFCSMHGMLTLRLHSIEQYFVAPFLIASPHPFGTNRETSLHSCINAMMPLCHMYGSVFKLVADPISRAYT